MNVTRNLIYEVWQANPEQADVYVITPSVVFKTTWMKYLLVIRNASTKPIQIFRLYIKVPV